MTTSWLVPSTQPPQVPRLAQRLRSRSLDRVLSRAARRRAGQGQSRLRQVRPGRAAAGAVADSRAAAAPAAISITPGCASAAPRSWSRSSGASKRPACRPQREEGVECCYARQTKFWITDPDGALVGDLRLPRGHRRSRPRRAAARRADAGARRPPTAPPPRAWEHRLREPIPARIPHDDNTLHEVRLEGTINVAPMPTTARDCWPSACGRCGRVRAISLHGLAGDRRATSHPAAGTGRRRAARAGGERRRRRARARRIRRDHDREAVADGVLRRRRRADARDADRGRASPGHRPRARGAPGGVPRADARGDRRLRQRFRRGVPTPLNVHDWQVLSKGSARESFCYSSRSQRSRRLREPN